MKLSQHPGLVIWAALCLAACEGASDEYVAAAAITRDGLARDGAGRKILGDLWRGEPHTPATWRSDMKAHRTDDTGLYLEVAGSRAVSLETLSGGIRPAN